jgi:hypothetical protein
MTRPRRGRGATCVLLAALLALAAPAQGDWLVTRDGNQVETRGAWQVKGKLVVFHTAKGELSSLRLADVDLEASRRETARAALARQAAEEARRQPPEKKPSVFVLTDDKVRHAAPGGTAGAVAQAPPSLSVASWERAAAAGDGHVVITGTLRNTSGVQASEISLAVQLLDAEGRTTDSGRAVLTATALAAGEQSGFQVEIPGATSYTQVKFEPKAVFAAPVEAAPPPAVPAPVEGEPLAVSSWQRVDNAGGRGGIEIQGTLQNATDTLVTNVAVEVQLYNEAGERVATAPGVLSATALQPRSTVDFRARFPGVFAFSDVKFELKGMPLDVSPAVPQPPA